MAGAPSISRLIFALVGLSPPSQASMQGPPEPALRLLRQAHAAVVRFGRHAADSLWPGFRPDTIPVLYVLPGQGTLLLGWPGAVPGGFSRLPGTGEGWKPAAEQGAASTGVVLGSRGTAQVVVRNEGLASLIGLTLHEAFHVHANAAAVRGRRFGRGENSFLVSTYPVFDVENEAGMALEGRLLASALEAPDREGQQALSRAFVAARESRHRRLGAELAEFEQLAELNEGLAEYQLIRSAELGAGMPGYADTAGARRIRQRLHDELRALTADVNQSLRLRFYRLGPAQGLLLDRLEGPRWKRRVLEQNLTLQDALADAAGSRDAERAVLNQVSAEFGVTELKRSAAGGVERLKALRHRQVDSLLSEPGLGITIMLDSMPGRSVGLCGIDPQNLLQVDPDRLLHTRWVRLCSGSRIQATFNTPAVQDKRQATWQAVLKPSDTVRIVAGEKSVALGRGQHLGVTDLKVESIGLELHASRAELWRDERSLFILIKP